MTKTGKGKGIEGIFKKWIKPCTMESKMSKKKNENMKDAVSNWNLGARTCVQAIPGNTSEEMRKWESKTRKQVNPVKLGNQGLVSQGTIWKPCRMCLRIVLSETGRLGSYSLTLSPLAKGFPLEYYVPFS